MAMGAGDLDRIIVIQRATTEPDELNSPVLTWSDFLTAAAKRVDVADGEKFAAGGIGGFLTARFTIRSHDLARGILPSDRLLHEGREWNIVGMKETADGRFRFLEITASVAAE